MSVMSCQSLFLFFSLRGVMHITYVFRKGYSFWRTHKKYLYMTGFSHSKKSHPLTLGDVHNPIRVKICTIPFRE